MGILDDAKKMGEAGMKGAETAQQWSQDANQFAAAAQAGLTEGSFDPNDPAFAPIEGVDLDAYAKAVAAVMKAGATTEDDAAKAAEGAGIPQGKWKAVNDGWIARMQANRVVMNRYGVVFQQQH
jgi:hypothetical protein